MLLQKLQADQVTALKSSDKDKLEVLRFIISRIKNREIEKRTELTDDEVVDILRKQVKELNEANAAFEKGGRQDLIDANNKQIEVLKTYLPAEISDEEIMSEVARIKEANSQAVSANPKALIGLCMKELKSKASPERIMAAINSVS